MFIENLQFWLTILLLLTGCLINLMGLLKISVRSLNK